MSVQSLILSIQSFFCRYRAFDPGIIPINICDNNLFPLEIGSKYLHLALPIFSIRLSFLFIVFVVHIFDFFLFPTDV